MQNVILPSRLFLRTLLRRVSWHSQFKISRNIFCETHRFEKPPESVAMWNILLLKWRDFQLLVQTELAGHHKKIGWRTTVFYPSGYADKYKWQIKAISLLCCIIDMQCTFHWLIAYMYCCMSVILHSLLWGQHAYSTAFNPLNPELNTICYLLALLAQHFLHVSRIRVKSLTLRLLMSYIYGAPILDVSRSHTTTQHSR